MTYTGTLTITTCWCGIRHALPRELYDWAHRTGRETYCPLGHSGVYKGSENEELRQQNKRLQAQLTHAVDQREAAERSARALRGHLTRLRNRIVAGVCPWCHRHFSNVERHVAGQHPQHVEKMREALS